MVDLLSEDQTLSSEQRECVNSIQLSAKALLTIVNDILDFSKIESGRFDIEEIPFNLAATVGGLCQLLTMFAQQKGLEFVYVTSLDDGLECIGDAARIRQVLSNLLMNALKFTDKGMVKISVSGTKLEPKRDYHEALQVKFVIEDTGIGIEKHVLKRLFTPFHQGDASTARLYGGTGLGLTISQNVRGLFVIFCLSFSS
jgi:signal transduction histidine kinase